MDSWDSRVSMRSDETWDGNFKDTPTIAELLAREHWLLIQLDNSGAPIWKTIVSRIGKHSGYSFNYLFSLLVSELVQ